MPIFNTLSEMRKAMDAKEISSEELCSYFTTKIKQHNSKLNAVVATYDTSAKYSIQLASKRQGGKQSSELGLCGMKWPHLSGQSV